MTAIRLVRVQWYRVSPSLVVVAEAEKSLGFDFNVDTRGEKT